MSDLLNRAGDENEHELSVGDAAGPVGDGRRTRQARHPTEQYQLPVKERDQLPDELSKAKTAEERKELRERLVSLPQRFLDLAEKNPKDPVALEALVQTVALANGGAFSAGDCVFIQVA